MIGFSTLRRAALAVALIATTGVGLATSSTEASAGWHGGRHGGWHHGWRNGGWRHGGWRHGPTWGGPFLDRPYYAGPRCNWRSRLVLGPSGWHRVGQRVCRVY